MEATEEVKKEYEISYLLPTEEAAEEMATALARHGGEVKTEGTVRPLRLAYPIKKVQQAFFGYTHFRAIPEQVKQLEHDLRTAPFLLRSLITVLPPLSPQGRMDVSGARPLRPAMRTAPTAEKKPAAAPALSNEALEKKIEEILQ